MNIKDVIWEDVDLLPEAIRSDTQKKPMPGLIKIGNRPVVIDAELFYRSSELTDPMMQILKNESDFYYVRLPLSFRPVEGMHLKIVSVEIELQENSNEAEAWSMEPSKVEQEVKVGIESQIDSSFKIVPTSLKSSIGSSEHYIVYQPVIEAFNLGRTDPAWEFRPSKGRQLSGIQLLHLVVRQPKGSRINCQLSISGDVEDRTGIFRFFGKIWREDCEIKNFKCPS